MSPPATSWLQVVRERSSAPGARRVRRTIHRECPHFVVPQSPRTPQTGDGMEVDVAEAAMWFRRAAEHGSVEAMYDQMIIEKVPTDVLAALDADIDDDKRLVKNSGPHDPSGKSCRFVEMKVHRGGAGDKRISFSLATALPGLVRIGRSSTDATRGAARDVEKCANSTASQSAKRGAASAISRSCSAPSPAFSAAIAPGTQ